jgi:ribosome biogenesis GTPase
MRGLIVRTQSGFYTVEIDSGPLICRLRGRLKQGPRFTDVASVGDWVEVSGQDQHYGTVESIEPRQRMLVRKSPSPRGDYQQIIIANPDQAIFVFSCARPAPRLGMLDRFLVIAERQHIPARIVANKVDLVGYEGAGTLFGFYEQLGYPLIYTSVHTGQGITELCDCLAGKISVLAGPSGVGKSSLLNAIQPGLGLAVREISRATQKGRHTTVVRQLFKLQNGGYVADTPGMKALALWDIQAEELDGYFPELRDLVEKCQFNDCTHIQEPGCAIREAVDSHKIQVSRYQSYIRMRSGQDD